MEIELTLDDDLVSDLIEATGIEDHSALVRRTLLEMQQRITAQRIIALGGTDSDAWAAPRRRPPDFIHPH